MWSLMWSLMPFIFFNKKRSKTSDKKNLSWFAIIYDCYPTCHVFFSIPSLRLRDRKHTTSWKKIHIPLQTIKDPIFRSLQPCNTYTRFSIILPRVTALSSFLGGVWQTSLIRTYLFKKKSISSNLHFRS